MASHGDSKLSGGPTRSAMDSTELAYAQQIYLYNEDVIAGGNIPPLLTKMLDVSSSFPDEVNSFTVVEGTDINVHH